MDVGGRTQGRRNKPSNRMEIILREPAEHDLSGSGDDETHDLDWQACFRFDLYVGSGLYQACAMPVGEPTR